MLPGMHLKHTTWESVVPLECSAAIHEIINRQGLTCIHISDLASVCFPRAGNPGTHSARHRTVRHPHPGTAGNHNGAPDLRNQ
eukprot:7578550-Alexandrium_andersonii.AAC.1